MRPTVVKKMSTKVKKAGYVCEVREQEQQVKGRNSGLYTKQPINCAILLITL